MFEAKGLSVMRGGKSVFKNIDFILESGAFHGIIGRNGSGKTTLLRALVGVCKNTSEHILLNEKPLNSWPLPSLARQIAWLPSENSLAFDLPVDEVIALGRYCWNSSGRIDPKGSSVVDLCMNELGISQFRSRYFQSLSAGQRKLVMIARVLAQDTPCIVLDEPCAHLDLATAMQVVRLFKQLTRQGKTVIASFHHLDLALRHCDELLVLDEGTVEQKATLEVDQKLFRRIFDLEVTFWEKSGSRRLIIESVSDKNLE